ncbi:TPA: hypothetical protein N0F65_009485 [Lagenidium giganteum]|uniref:Uncharacterized protein n=1 Tax=Lagenidium giganteum TaxID=4803 RepID=A0AAV2ZK47_9STRA|nr:TPA: hypothetical protein N0F65_009485 [Lagenidium giganteum]
MKTVFAVAVACAAALMAPTAHAWWDNGHMLVGQVASELMDKADVATIEQVLDSWEKDFPNTNKIATAAVWPDLIKCSKKTSSCNTPLFPSLSQMGEWHFVDLPINVDGSDWNGHAADLDLFKASLGGEAMDILEKSFLTMNTTKSLWAANLVLRNFIHVFGDIHQPMHSVSGISQYTPTGDAGGNAWVFPQGCAFSNLHMVWDAAGGAYSQNNWMPEIKFMDKLKKNATELIGLLPSQTDELNFEQYSSLSDKAFIAAMDKSKALRYVVLDTYSYAQTIVYPALDLTMVNKTVPCPPDWYFSWASQIAKMRIATAGKRLSVILTQFARQIRQLGLVSNNA